MVEYISLKLNIKYVKERINYYKLLIHCKKKNRILNKIKFSYVLLFKRIFYNYDISNISYLSKNKKKKN